MNLGNNPRNGVISHAAAAAKSFQSCLTLCDPIDDSPPGSPIPATLQARTLEWVAISFSNACKWKVKEKSLSCVRMDCSLPGSSVHGIFQARVLEWGAIAFSYVTSHAHGHKRFILALYYFPLLIYLISKVLQFKTYPSFIPEGCEKLYTNLYKRINRLMDECTD